MASSRAGASRRRNWTALAVCLAGMTWCSPMSGVQRAAASPPDHSPPLARSMTPPRRAGFEPNRGQWAAPVRFVARDGAATLFLTATEAVWRLRGRDEAQGEDWVRLRWLGADPAAAPVGARRRPGRVHYARGADPARWQRGLPLFGRVVYRDLYPGIDLVFHDERGQLEYDFVVHPGADPRAVRLRVEGPAQARLADTGALVLTTAGGTITHRPPLAFQTDGHASLPITARYTVSRNETGAGALEVAFALGPYDPTRPLIIDPSVAYTTVIDATFRTDNVVDIAADGTGNLWLAGMTANPEFPLTEGALRDVKSSLDDGYVVKLDPAGEIVYATYLGGSFFNCVAGVDVDSQGNAFVAGTTLSNDFPVTPGALQDALIDNGAGDGFLTKLDPTGALVYSTYVGGTGAETCSGRGNRLAGVAVAPDDAVYLMLANPTSLDWPLLPDTAGNTLDGNAMVIRFSPILEPEWGRFIGGTVADRGYAVRTDGEGNAYVLGTTNRILGEEHTFPTTSGAFQETSPSDGAHFIAKYSPQGDLLYATLFGPTSGSDAAQGGGFDVDADGNVYLAVVANGGNMPVTDNAYQRELRGFSDFYVAKLDPTGSQLVYGTYLGGSAAEQIVAEGIAIAVDEDGSAHVGGLTTSTDFPLLDPFQPNPRENAIAKLTPDGSGLEYASYVDLGVHALTARDGAAYVGGRNGDGNGISAMRIDAEGGPPPCPGDCNGSGDVTVNELILGVRIALEIEPLATCPAMDSDGNGRVLIADLIAAVNMALSAC